MNLSFRFIWICLILPSIIGCEFERFTSYNLEGQELIKTTPVSGTITNLFTGRAVYDARVSIGDQETFSDENGFYSINYILSDDDSKNKPTTFRIAAENYFPRETTSLLLPTANSFDFYIEYAAPIIRDIARFTNSENRSEQICQVIITDYQGLGNIREVKGVFPYSNESGRTDTLKIDIPLYRVESSVTGYFQAIFQSHPQLAPYHYVRVLDKDGYRTEQLHAINPFFPDFPIF